MPQTVKSKTEVKAAVETEPKTKSRARTKVIPKKIYLQFAGKEVEGDALMEKFKVEWCKENKITAIKNLKIYYKIDDQKAYFVANDATTIIIDFK